MVLPKIPRIRPLLTVQSVTILAGRASCPGSLFQPLPSSSPLTSNQSNSVIVRGISCHSSIRNFQQPPTSKQKEYAEGNPQGPNDLLHCLPHTLLAHFHPFHTGLKSACMLLPQDLCTSIPCPWKTLSPDVYVAHLLQSFTAVSSFQ